MPGFDAVVHDHRDHATLSEVFAVRHKLVDRSALPSAAKEKDNRRTKRARITLSRLEDVEGQVGVADGFVYLASAPGIDTGFTGCAWAAIAAAQTIAVKRKICISFTLIITAKTCH